MIKFQLKTSGKITIAWSAKTDLLKALRSLGRRAGSGVRKTAPIAALTMAAVLAASTSSAQFMAMRALPEIALARPMPGPGPVSGFGVRGSLGQGAGKTGLYFPDILKDSPRPEAGLVPLMSGRQPPATYDEWLTCINPIFAHDQLERLFECRAKLLSHNKATPAARQAIASPQRENVTPAAPREISFPDGDPELNAGPLNMRPKSAFGRGRPVPVIGGVEYPWSEAVPSLAYVAVKSGTWSAPAANVYLAVILDRYCAGEDRSAAALSLGLMRAAAGEAGKAWIWKQWNRLDQQDIAQRAMLHIWEQVCVDLDGWLAKDSGTPVAQRLLAIGKRAERDEANFLRNHDRHTTSSDNDEGRSALDNKAYPGLSPEDDVSLTFIAKRVGQKLSLRQLQILVLYEDHYSFEEIGYVLNVRPGTARSIVSKAKQAAVEADNASRTRAQLAGR